MHRHVPEYLLRWRYEWKDRPTKYGMWSHSGAADDVHTRAWDKNHDGLLWAMVEAKGYVNRADQKIVVAVPGCDFLVFQWLALGLLPMFNLKGPTRAATRIGGLKILTRYEEISVLDCGKIERGPHTSHDINFATYGK